MQIDWELSPHPQVTACFCLPRCGLDWSSGPRSEAVIGQLLPAVRRPIGQLGGAGPPGSIWSRGRYLWKNPHSFKTFHI